MCRFSRKKLIFEKCHFQNIGHQNKPQGATFQCFRVHFELRSFDSPADSAPRASNCLMCASDRLICASVAGTHQLVFTFHDFPAFYFPSRRKVFSKNFGLQIPTFDLIYCACPPRPVFRGCAKAQHSEV